MPAGPPRPGPWPGPRRASAALAAAFVCSAAVAPLLVPEPAVAAPTPAAAAADGIHLATPVEGVDPLTSVDLGLRKDRLLTSVVPGPVRDEEEVRVGVGPTGAPVQVTDRQ